jgi:hypothetical protein
LEELANDQRGLGKVRAAALGLEELLGQCELIRGDESGAASNPPLFLGPANLLEWCLLTRKSGIRTCEVLPGGDRAESLLVLCMCDVKQQPDGSDGDVPASPEYSQEIDTA